MSNSSIDTNALLWKKSEDIATLLIPAFLFVGLLMVIGLVGNSAALYFYGWKTKTTPATIFIFSLAIFDLISCCISMPMEISDMRYFFTFESVAACKMFRFVNHFAIIASALTLLGIAVDRYRRICKPFDQQMTVKQARIVCGVCASASVLFSWPAMVLYTAQPVKVKYSGTLYLEGKDCTITFDESYRPYIWAFHIFHFLAFVIMTIALAILYAFIGHQLFKHKKFRFYVAKSSIRRTHSGQSGTLGSDCSSEQVNSSSNTVPTQSTQDFMETYEKDNEVLSENVQETEDEIPDATPENAVDLREFVTRGLPDVDADRPTSGRTVVTDISGRSKRSIQSVKSVTICDSSQNQVFQIEPRRDKQHWSEADNAANDNNNSKWINGIIRPESVSSMATFSTRPASSMSSASSKDSDTQPGTSDEKKSKERRSSSASSVRSKSNKVRPTSAGTTATTAVSVISGISSVKSNASSRSMLILQKLKMGYWKKNADHRLNADTDNVKDLRMKLLDINTVKYTVIMFIVALVFVISFLPYLSLIIWNTFSITDYEINYLSEPAIVGYEIGIRSYFINSACNPLIYGFFNSQFRDFFFSIFCCCCYGLKKNKRNKKEVQRT